MRKVPLLEVRPELREWLRYKNFYFTSQHPINDDLFSATLADRLITGFQELAAVYQYLWGIKHQVDSDTYAGRL